jgi:heat-inducible transcriptional repressor
VAAVTQLKKTRLSKIDFIRVDTSNVLLLVVLEGGIVHHKIVGMPYDLSQDSLEDLTRRINALAGHEWGEVRSTLQSYIMQELGRYADSCREALGELDRILDGERATLFTGSLVNLFNVPDFQDIGRFRALFSILEQEDSLLDLMRKCNTTDGIGVMIGEENDMPEMENCAVVLSSSSSEGQKTMLGVIGPKRMNYEKVISVLDRVLRDIVNCSGENEGDR